MSAILLFFLIFLSCLLLLIKQYKASFVLMTLTWLGYAAVALGPIPYLLLKPLQSDAAYRQVQWKDTNTIVLLGAGATEWPNVESTPVVESFTSSQSWGQVRVKETARLYYDCHSQNKVCRIITSGGDPGGHGTAEAEIMARELTELGVTAADIRPESASYNTYENARNTAEILKADKTDEVVLVTSGVHMPRAKLLFKHFGLKVLPAPADHLDIHFKLNAGAFNFYATDLALHEYGGILQYYLLRMFNLN